MSTKQANKESTLLSNFTKISSHKLSVAMEFQFGWFCNLVFGKLFHFPLVKESHHQTFHVMLKVGVNIILLMMSEKDSLNYTIQNTNLTKDFWNIGKKLHKLSKIILILSRMNWLISLGLVIYGEIQLCWFLQWLKD